MTPRILRRVLLPFALVLPLTLTACFPVPIPVPVGPRQDQDAPAPTPPRGTTQEGALPADLSFADGDDLDPVWIAQWAERMAVGDDYAVASPDDGNGNWSYTHLPTGCTVRFWQGDVSDLGTAADDSALSDRLLSAYTNESQSVIDANAMDDIVPFGYDGGGFMDVRAVTADNSASGRSIYVSARGIATLQGGLVFGVECPSGSEASEVALTVESDLAGVLTPQ
jgi:hypothetical protein